MNGLALAWDRRVERLLARLPDRVSGPVRALRRPERRLARIGAGLLLVLGGLLSILPVLGIWMLPLGLALLAEDRPGLKAPLERAARWCEDVVRRIRRRPRPDRGLGPHRRRPDGAALSALPVRPPGRGAGT